MYIGQGISLAELATLAKVRLIYIFWFMLANQM